MQRSEYKTLAWHTTQWKSLLGGGLGRISHATLLLGKSGLGQEDFAEALASLLLCEAPQPAHEAHGETAWRPPRACGSCPSCRWLQAHSHPDFRHVQPEDADEVDEAQATTASESGRGKKRSSVIKVGAIRALEDFVYVGSHRHGRRVIIIDPAEAMNVVAANALLKILEEPPSSVYFILISSKQRALLPTLRSRCRSLVFEPPTRAQAEAWLRSAGAETRAARLLDLAGGAPATVLQWQGAGLLPALEGLVESLFAALDGRSRVDPLALAGQWDALMKKETALSLELLVDTVQRWVFDLTELEAGGGTLHFHQTRAVPEVHLLAPLETRVRGWRELLRFRRAARHPLNQLLFLEDFAVHVLHTVQSPRRD